MTAERLWSPQMKKWAKDAERHGRSIHFAYWGGGHSSQYRITDTLDDRITDDWDGNANTFSSFVRLTD